MQVMGVKVDVFSSVLALGALAVAGAGAFWYFLMPRLSVTPSNQIKRSSPADMHYYLNINNFVPNDVARINIVYPVTLQFSTQQLDAQGNGVLDMGTISGLAPTFDVLLHSNTAVLQVTSSDGSKQATIQLYLTN